MQHRAYSLLEIKAVDRDERIIEGIASTPTPDRGGDVMEPAGAEFSLPLPFLWFHKQDEPIGEVFAADVRPEGIYIKARVSKVDKPSRLKSLVDDAWAAFTAAPPLVRGLSIGWSEKESAAIPGTKLRRYTKWTWGELSAVTVPMNSEATITAVKSAVLAASGRFTPSDTGTSPLKRTMTTSEQITSFENTLKTKAGRMAAIMSSAAEKGETLDQAQTEEYDTLKGEVKSIEDHLVRLKDHESLMVKTATPIAPSTATTATTPQVAASELRGGNSVIQVKANVPKGTAFTRYVMAKIIGKNSMSDAIRHVENNKQWMDQTPEVLQMVKAVVNWGTIAEPAWAAPLAVQQPINDFLELLRPETLIGKIPGLRNVPFNVSMPVQTGGGTYNWVGEGAPKPVGNLQFSSVTLGIAKAAGIIVISEELAKISSPSAEGVIRNDMVRGMAQYLDQQFIDPTVAAVTNVSPASITNAAQGIGTAGTSGDNARTDIKALIALFTSRNYPISETVLIMSEANAFALSTALTTNGVEVNSNISASGGTILGLRVVTSQAAGNVVALVHAPSILYADDGGVNIDVSREAAVEMNTVPTSPVSAASVLVSLWQNNLVGLRAERFINWKRARTTAVVYTTATYI